MFVVTVVSVDGESTAKAFGAMSDARKWASTGALNEFDGDVAAVTIHETVADDPRQAIDEVKTGGAKFLEGKAHPITAKEVEITGRYQWCAYQRSFQEKRGVHDVFLDTKALKEQEPPPSQRTTSTGLISIPMRMEGSTYVVPVQINNAISLDFVIDSGASDVSIPADVVISQSHVLRVDTRFALNSMRVWINTKKVTIKRIVVCRAQGNSISPIVSPSVFLASYIIGSLPQWAQFIPKRKRRLNDIIDICNRDLLVSLPISRRG